MYFQPKNLKSTIHCGCQKITSVFRVLGIYNFARTPNWVFYPECWAATTQYKKIRMFPWNTKSDISSSIPRQSLPMQRNMHIVVERKGQGGKLFLISAKNQRCLYFNHWNSIKGFQHFEKFWLLRKDDTQNRLKFFGTIFFYLHENTVFYNMIWSTFDICAKELFQILLSSFNHTGMALGLKIWWGEY